MLLDGTNEILLTRKFKEDTINYIINIILLLIFVFIGLNTINIKTTNSGNFKTGNNSCCCNAEMRKCGNCCCKLSSPGIETKPLIFSNSGNKFVNHFLSSVNCSGFPDNLQTFLLNKYGISSTVLYIYFLKVQEHLTSIPEYFISETHILRPFKPPRGTTLTFSVNI